MTETPTVTGFGVSAGDGFVFVRLDGPEYSVGAPLATRQAVQLGHTILDVAGEPHNREEIARLREKIRRQAATIDEMRRVLERKNRELDALHYVWCDGGCPRGVHRWNDALITRELVETAERNARRLRRWYRIVEFRLRLPGAEAWQRKHWERAAQKTDLVPEDRKPPGIRLSRRYAIRVLIATWVLAIATAILALSGPVALFAWLNARKQDRDRRQREHEQEMEDRILKNAGDRFVPKSQVAGVATLGALGAVITFLAWLDAKKPKA